MSKWQPIKTAPLNIPIIVTDGSRQYMAMQKTSWVFNDPPPLPSGGNMGQAATYMNPSKPFTPTHWLPVPPVPKAGA